MAERRRAWPRHGAGVRTTCITGSHCAFAPRQRQSGVAVPKLDRRPSTASAMNGEGQWAVQLVGRRRSASSADKTRRAPSGRSPRRARSRRCSRQKSGTDPAAGGLRRRLRRRAETRHRPGPARARRHEAAVAGRRPVPPASRPGAGEPCTVRPTCALECAEQTVATVSANAMIATIPRRSPIVRRADRMTRRRGESTGGLDAPSRASSGPVPSRSKPIRPTSVDGFVPSASISRTSRTSSSTSTTGRRSRRAPA